MDQSSIKVNLMTEKAKTWTRSQVEKLLEQQIADCSEAIDGSNLSEFTAKRKILDTPKVKF